MKFHVLTLIVVAATSLSAVAATPTLVTRCGGSAGYSYFHLGGVVTAKDAGWQEDSISAGQSLLMREDAGKYDILFSDAMGRTVSSREDGAQVVVVSEAGSQLVLLVNYPEMNVETWVFSLDARGAGKLTYSQARYGKTAVSKKHSLMLANCLR